MDDIVVTPEMAKNWQAWIDSEGPEYAAIRDAFDATGVEWNWRLPKAAIAALMTLGWRPPDDGPLPGSPAEVRQRVR